MQLHCCQYETKGKYLQKASANLLASDNVMEFHVGFLQKLPALSEYFMACYFSKYSSRVNFFPLMILIFITVNWQI